MKKLLMVFLILIVSCTPTHRKITEKDYKSATTSICTKVGNTYIPSHGGQCFGIIERIDEKYILRYEDGGWETVSQSVYDSYNVGDYR